jgi:AraC-like DNA-binding protein
MIYEHCQLPPDLEKYIEAVFYIKGFAPDHSIERVVPTGHVFFIFELDDIPRNTYDNETLQPIGFFRKAWISGMHKNFISISAHQDSEMLVVQFKSAGAYPFFHFPLQNISEKVISAEEVMGTEIIQLRDSIIQAEEYHLKMTLVVDWLVGRFDEQQAPSGDLLNFIDRLQKEPVSKFNEIIQSYPHTQKQLIQHFKKYVGITPKIYQRILRFNEILRIIQNKEKISWADVAYSCDYADQSHFIKEFSLFSGFNPQEFIKVESNRGRSNFFPVDGKG